MITLYNDDCIQAIKLINDNTIDLIITDPPYNLGNFMIKRQTNLNKLRENFFVGAGWDNLDYDKWYSHMELLFIEMSRVSKQGSSMIMFMSLIKIESIIQIAEKYNFYYKTTGIWHKTNPMPRNMNLHFVNSTEAWIYFVYKKRTGVFNNENKLIHDFIETSTIKKSEKKYGGHPTQKPEKLIEFFIKLLSNENDLVLDPFMGSGTSGVVSSKFKRKFIGIELDPKYFSISKSRIYGENNEGN